MEEEVAPKKQAPPGRFPRVVRSLRRLALLLLIGLFASIGLIVWLAFQDEPVAFDTAAANGIAFDRWRKVVPGQGLPPDLPLMDSNNNLDVVRYRGRFYFAFRTSPVHFPHGDTQLHIMSSGNRERWEHLETVQMPGLDLREPRFLVFQDRLFLYFASLEGSPRRFEPQELFVMELQPDGTFDEPQATFRPGFIPWRLRTHDGRAWMTTYYGRGLYSLGGRPAEVRLLVSDDGRTWTPVSESPQIVRTGASECDFVFDADGNLRATVRLEVEGALLCTAPADDLATWTATYIPHKIDSALLFQQDDTVYLVARRNLGGAFRRGAEWWPEPLRRLWSLTRYSLTRKRTALYRVDFEAGQLVPIVDLPSWGDTAFAGVARLDDRSLYLMNYTSPLNEPDLPWFFAQLGRTEIHDTVIRFGGR